MWVQRLNLLSAMTVQARHFCFLAAARSVHTLRICFALATPKCRTTVQCASPGNTIEPPIRELADVVVVGGGAAGLTAAYFAAKSAPSRRIIVLERTREAGKKRCNVVPGHVNVDNDYFTDSSKSALSAVFSSWSLEECLTWMSEDIGLELSLEEESNKYFPSSNSSRDVRDRLVCSCENQGVEFQYNASVVGLAQCDGGWECNVQDRGVIQTKRVVFATGGKSFPRVGTDGTGHKVLENLGHSINETYPALTPLTGKHPGSEKLPGVSLYDVDIQTRVGKGKGGVRKSNRSGFLFTHKGYSGPSILDLSHLAVLAIEGKKERPKLLVNWIGESEGFWENKLRGVKVGTVVNCLNRNGIPQRLCRALCTAAGVPLDRRMSEVRKAEMKSLVNALVRYNLPYNGHQGYRKAEVTGGGVPLSEINCATMESRLFPGVHLCGEILDVFGRIGGFNFYWAWVSGRLAGLGSAQQL